MYRLLALRRASAPIARGTILLLVCVMLAVVWPLSRVRAALTDVPTAWSNFSFVNYTFQNQIIDDDMASSDPSNGGAAVQPASIDIASCTPDGSSPGTAPSVQLAYYDTDGDYDTLNDAWISFRIRLADTPLEGGQVKGYEASHWNILIDIDADGYKEFVIDIDGSVASQQPDRVYLLYNDSNTQEVAGRSGAQRAASDVLGGDEIGLWYASGPGASGAPVTYNHTRVLQDMSQTCNGANEYWLDVQVPLTAFNVGGSQKITAYTPIAFFYSTSTSTTDPLQKDWMMDPNNQGGSAFILTDPITFGDIYQAEETPTAVRLASFSGQARGGAVVLGWETGSEIGNLGFNLYRESHPEGGDRALVNDALIPSQALGRQAGASYAYRDADVQPGAAYAYWLEDWDARGTSTLHGAVVVRVPENQTPRVVRAWPRKAAVPANRWRVYTTVYRDADGADDMAHFSLAFGGIDAIVRYDAATGLLRIWNGKRWSRGVAPGKVAWLGTPEMAIRLQGTDVSWPHPEIVRIRWQVKFKDGVQGLHPLLAQVVDANGADSGWQRMGAITVR